MTVCDGCGSDRLVGSQTEFRCRECDHRQPRRPDVPGNPAVWLAAARESVRAARVAKTGSRAVNRPLTEPLANVKVQAPDERLSE